MRFLLPTLILLLAACGGSPAVTRTPARATPTPGAAATIAATPGGVVSGEELCYLTAADWQQFNYVTGAEPDLVPDQPPGTTICQYASGLFLEVYTHESEAEAEDTLQTMVDNVPLDDPQELTLPGADEVVFDSDTGDGHAAIAFRAGNAAFLITGLARETVQAELMTLAGLVLARSTAIQ